MIFFLATAYILGREYFELAAMRFRPPAEAKLLRKRNAATVYIGGLFIAAFVSIPIVNLATPLFAMALMVHVHKRLSRTEYALVRRAPFEQPDVQSPSMARRSISPGSVGTIQFETDETALAQHLRSSMKSIELRLACMIDAEPACL